MTRLVEDRALREGFFRGGRPALAEVYRVYAPGVFAFLRKGFVLSAADRRVVFRGVADAGELEGFVQEVFARAFAEPARRRYDGLRPYRNYLFAIAKNLVGDALRSRARLFVEIDDGATVEQIEASPLAAPPLSPDEALLRQQIQERVEAFVGALDEAERGVFTAYFREGASVAQAAADLQTSEHYVKSTAHKLRKRFFQTMRRHGYFAGYELAGATLVRAKDVLLLVVAAGVLK